MKTHSQSLKPNASNLRKNLTGAEQKFWRYLRRKQIHGKNFYRQKTLLVFIVDFYCPAAGLVIELDGGQHFEAIQKRRDALRDQALVRLGLPVLRFHNRQVMQEVDALREVIGRRVLIRTGMICLE